MASEKELWEIQLDFKLNKDKEAEQKTQAMLARMKEADKRLTASILAEEKRQTA